jgi:hypothetical protein
MTIRAGSDAGPSRFRPLPIRTDDAIAGLWIFSGKLLT